VTPARRSCEHYAEILTERGYDRSEIERLMASGALINAAARMIANLRGTSPPST
jgi:hypothetical protein